MLRLGGLAKGTMPQCLQELKDSNLPEDFKLRQIRSLLRYLREVSSLVDHVKQDSGFDGDTTAYLDSLCAKEDSDLIRRVSHTRVLRQDYDEKRLAWRKQKKSLINAIGAMTARALRFEDKERKTIALYALEFYKNIMGRDNGAILGESESTDTLIEQYRRHRDEISKIPMYADNIVKMLKDIRRTVRASAKLQPGSNAFAQFLDEWWSSVVQFLQHSSIVDAEKNAREVMQTLKTLKCKQEENKKKEMARLLSKLDAQAGLGPPVGRLSELWREAPAPENPEETVVQKDLRQLSISVDMDNMPPPQHESTNRDPDRNASPIPSEDDRLEQGPNPPTISADALCSAPSPRCALSAAEVVGGGGGPSVSFDCDEIRSPRGSVASIGAGSTASAISSGGWDEGSVSTGGTDTRRGSVDMDALVGVSGIPGGDFDDDDSGDEDSFEAADNFDLGAIDLCTTGTGADGQMIYKDQEEVRMPSVSVSAKPKTRGGVEQARFSAALDYFRQEQVLRQQRMAMPPRPPSPKCLSPFRSPPSPLSSGTANTHFVRKVSGTGMTIGMGGRSGVGLTRGAVKALRRKASQENRDEPPSGRDTLPTANSGVARSSPRTLSLYIPRLEQVGTQKQRASKTPTAAMSARRPGPPKVSARAPSSASTAPRSVFFA